MCNNYNGHLGMYGQLEAHKRHKDNHEQINRQLLLRYGGRNNQTVQKQGRRYSQSVFNQSINVFL